MIKKLLIFKFITFIISIVQKLLQHRIDLFLKGAYDKCNNMWNISKIEIANKAPNYRPALFILVYMNLFLFICIPDTII